MNLYNVFVKTLYISNGNVNDNETKQLPKNIRI